MEQRTSTSRVASGHYRGTWRDVEFEVWDVLQDHTPEDPGTFYKWAISIDAHIGHVVDEKPDGPTKVTAVNRATEIIDQIKDADTFVDGASIEAREIDASSITASPSFPTKSAFADAFPELPFVPAEKWGEDAPDGIYVGVPEQEYHDHPAFNRSFMARFLDCPARGKRYLEEQEEEEDEQKDAFDIGDGLHMSLLEPDRYENEVEAKPDECEGTLGSGDPCTNSPSSLWSNGEQKTWRCGHHKPGDGWTKETGYTALTEEQAGRVETMRDHLLHSGEVGDLLNRSPQAREVTLLYTLSEGVRLKARPDLVTPMVHEDGFAMTDLKTTRHTVHPRDVKKAIGDHGVWLQDTFYSYVWNRLAAESDLDPTYFVRRFTYAFAEKEPPHLVGGHSIEPDTGSEIYQRMTDGFSELVECVKTGTWPGYPWEGEITEIDLPPWTRRRYGI